MHSLCKTFLSSAALATGTLLWGPCSAPAQQLVTVGTASYPNGFPFGISGNKIPLYAAGNEFQELYTHDNFQQGTSTPVMITGVAFASSPSSGFNHPQTATYFVTLSLSTTKAEARRPTSLMDVTAFQNNFDANKGADFSQVFSGSLTANLSATNSFDLFFPVKPFRYDPSQGNLLVDIVVNRPAVDNAPMPFNAGVDFAETANALTLRAFQSGPGSSVGVDQFGLFTQFTVMPVPPDLVSLTFTSPVPGGTVLTATVTLSGPVSTDTVVGLSSSDPTVVRVFRSVLIPAGSQSATFTINTFRSHTTKTVTIQATLGQVVQTQDLTITGR